jgi:hypothetical protein
VSYGVVLELLDELLPEVALLDEPDVALAPSVLVALELPPSDEAPPVFVPPSVVPADVVPPPDAPVEPSPLAELALLDLLDPDELSVL